MVQKFRKKPVVIEAVQFTGKNDKECLEFCNGLKDPETDKPILLIDIDGATIPVLPGDWVVKETGGVFRMYQDHWFREYFELNPD